MSRDLLLSPACLAGQVRVPPSKSVAHRALLCAALAQGGASVVHNIAASDDILATLQGAVALGARLKRTGDTVEVHSAAPYARQDGDPALIDCKESGSTLRFLLPIALALGCPVRMIGQGNLGKRPLDAYFHIIREQGIPFEATEGKLDLTLRGRLRPGVFHLPGNVSSQYITGLLLALPLLDGPSQIVVEGPLESKGYLDLTLQVMQAFGAGVSHDAYRIFEVSPGGYRPADYIVEGDYSQAAFFLAAGALAGIRQSMMEGGDAAGTPAEAVSESRDNADNRRTTLETGDTAGGLECTTDALAGVPGAALGVDGAAAAATSQGSSDARRHASAPENSPSSEDGNTVLRIAGLRPDSAQGDRAVCDILRRMGAQVEWDAQGNLCCTARRLRGCVIDAAQYPDIIPVLAAVACACEGETHIVNAGRLRIKECDRLHAVASELTCLGAAVQEGTDDLRIAGRPEQGLPLLGGKETWSHGDHRMAMTLAVAAAVCERPFVLRDYPCVSKSYPDFFEDYHRLGGVYDELDLGKQM